MAAGGTPVVNGTYLTLPLRTQGRYSLLSMYHGRQCLASLADPITPRVPRNAEGRDGERESSQRRRQKYDEAGSTTKSTRGPNHPLLALEW